MVITVFKENSLIMHYSKDLIKYNKLSNEHNLMVNQAGDFVFANDKNLSAFLENKLKKSDLTWLEHTGLLQNCSGEIGRAHV